MILLGLFTAVLGLSYGGTAWIRRYAVGQGLWDVPNERSSHALPTPRGGGLAIAVSFLLGLVGAWWLGVLPGRFLVLCMGSGLVVAGVGFVDDHGDVTAASRLAAHTLAAAWILYWLGGMPAVSAFGLQLPQSIVLDVVAGVGLVWLTNLYNFMDGIDGFAGVEAVTVAFCAALLAFVDPSSAAAWIVPGILVAAAGGFVLWNFPPAKIFMGDAGSGFLGASVGAIGLHEATQTASAFWSWLILLGVFVVDATVTLIRRLVRGEHVLIAHRQHGYQHAASTQARHRSVTLALAVINVAWLLPIAYLVRSRALDGAVGLVIAYIPLTWTALRLGSGLPPRVEN